MLKHAAHSSSARCKIKIQRRTCKAALFLGAAMVLTPAAASAQDDAVLAGDEILVTADRLNRPEQDTPVFVTLFDSTAIERQRIIRTEDFANLVPNFVVDDAFTTLTTTGTFRGLSQLDNSDPPYAIVVDGVPLTTQREFNFSLFDVERVEVAAGPQGALYGRNAIAGAIIINTRDASEEWAGGFSASYGVGNQLRATGNISGPINDRVAMRLAAVVLHDNGRLENPFRDEEVDFVDHDFTLRAGLDIQAADWLNFDIRGQYRDFDGGALRNSLVLSNDANDFQPPASNRRNTSEGHAAHLTFRATVDLPFGELVSVSGFTDQTEFSQGDLDFTDPSVTPFQAVQFLRSELEAFSQEIRLSSELNDRITWFLGGRYLYTDNFNPAFLPFFDDGRPLNEFDDVRFTCIQFIECFIQDITTVTNTFGFFGQVQFDVTERLGVGVALRYDEDDREQRDFLTGNVLQETFSGWQPNIRLSYDFGDQLIYASWGRAFLPGGFNTPPLTEGFDEQTVDTIDIGVKTEWLDGRLTLNGAFFYSFVDGYQFFQVEPTAQILRNIDEVEIYGVEIEARAHLSEAISFYAAVGTTDTEIVRNDSVPETEGNSVPRTMDYNLNIGVDINQPLNDKMTLVGSVGYERRGDRIWNIENDFVQQPVDLLNARIGVDKGRYNLSFFGKNLTDEEFFIDLFAPTEARPTTIAHRNRPREYGVEVSVRF